jgi:hypothetical protein
VARIGGTVPSLGGAACPNGMELLFSPCHREPPWLVFIFTTSGPVLFYLQLIPALTGNHFHASDLSTQLIFRSSSYRDNLSHVSDF